MALHTEMCEKSRVNSVEEGHDVESDVAEETMSAMVKLAKAICEPYDIGQPTAKWQSRGLPGESWLHDEASSCPCRVEQKRASSDDGRHARFNCTREEGVGSEDQSPRSHESQDQGDLRFDQSHRRGGNRGIETGAKCEGGGAAMVDEATTLERQVSSVSVRCEIRRAVAQQR